MEVILGYARVSTQTQDITRQVRNIKAVYPDAIMVLEAFTGTKMERPEWTKLYKTIMKHLDLCHKVILVFDGHKVAGNLESKYEHNKNLVVVFTKDGETADAYIEREVHNLGRRFEVYVVTSDSLEQQTIFQRGAVRISSVEFYNLVFNTSKDIKETTKKISLNNKNILQDNINEDVLRKLEEIRRG